MVPVSSSGFSRHFFGMVGIGVGYFNVLVYKLLGW